MHKWFRDQPKIFFADGIYKLVDLKKSASRRVGITWKSNVFV